MIYPSNFEEKLGFDRIRHWLANHCISPMGQSQVAELGFETSLEVIAEKLMLIQEFRMMMENGLPFPVRDYSDLRAELYHLRIEGTVISQEVLFELKPGLNALRAILRFTNSENAIRFPAFKRLCEGILLEDKIWAECNRLTDDKGDIPDSASAELASIRRQIRQKLNQIDRQVNRLLQEAKKAGWADADVEATVRNGRMVIPVKAADKRKLRGFIHDESATGQTVYIEPADVLETNNEVRELEYAEKREINRILAAFSQLIRPFTNDLLAGWELLGAIDLIRSKSLMAAEMEAVIPQLTDKPLIHWKQCRHPLLQQKLKNMPESARQTGEKKNIVPLDLDLDELQRILVISGPNAGGKSVCLKTTGLVQYMLQCGLAVPMEKDSECGIFNKIFIDIGDEQSLDNDLSTYSSHLLNMKHYLENADQQTLFLIDEFGTGTEPQLGGAIAEAVLAKLNKMQAFGLVTTHYANLKLFADEHQGVINGAMLFDTKRLEPLYILQTGRPGSSFAFEIARKIGFPENILESAATIGGKSHLDFDQQLQQLEVEKKALNKKQTELRLADQLLNEVIEKYKRQLKQLEDRRKEMLSQAGREAKALIDKANRQIEHTIKEIRESQADKERTKALRFELKASRDKLGEEAETLAEKLADAEEKEEAAWQATELKAGDLVSIEEMDITGELISVSEHEAVVSFHSVKLRTSPEKLSKLSKRETRKQSLKQRRLGNSNSVTSDLNEKVSNFKLTIDLRGKRAEEALEQTAKYIDEAILLSVKEVNILHGKGNGILRKLIREFLSKQKEVAAFEDAPPETGGNGVTRVSLK
ncbi:MAG TPA: Smr/MutS family protein [Bacteroidales bacterium]|nr:Smr/MutS family protein [Bacteroidales bacterium]